MASQSGQSEQKCSLPTLTAQRRALRDLPDHPRPGGLTAISSSVHWRGGRPMKRAALIPVLLMLATPALAENDVYLSRDQTIPAETYLKSDGGMIAKEPSGSDWETFVYGKEAAPPERFVLP